MEELDAAALVGFKLCDRGFELLQCCFVQIDFFRILERCWFATVHSVSSLDGLLFLNTCKQRFRITICIHGLKCCTSCFFNSSVKSCEKFNHFILAALGVFQILHAYTIEQVCVSVPQMTQRNLVPLPKKKHQVEITAIGYGLAPKEHVYLPDSCFLLHVKVVIALGLNGHHATGHIAVTRW